MKLLEILLVVQSKSDRDFVRMKFGEMSASAIIMVKLRLLEKVWWGTKRMTQSYVFRIIHENI